MKLLTLTPTGLIAPIINMVESSANPYDMPEETPVQKADRMARRHIAMGGYFERITSAITDMGRRLVEKYKLPRFTNAIIHWSSDSHHEVAPGHYLHKDLYKHKDTDPSINKLIQLTKKRYRYTMSQKQLQKAQTVVAAQETKQTKAEMQQQAARSVTRIDPSQVPREVRMGKTVVLNPYYSRITARRQAYEQLEKWAGSPYGFKFKYSHLYKIFSRLTAILKLNNKDWGVGYGYYVLPLFPADPKKPITIRHGWLFLTADNSVLWNGKDGELVNAIGSRISISDFLSAAAQRQDDFLVGKI